MSSEDLKRFRDIMCDMFPIMIKDLDKAIRDMENGADFIDSSNDFLLAMVSANMLVNKEWLTTLEGVLEEWENEADC